MLPAKTDNVLLCYCEVCQHIHPVRLNANKTGTSQVGAISKAQKAQNIFFGKKLEIFEKKILSENVAQCRKM